MKTLYVGFIVCDNVNKFFLYLEWASLILKGYTIDTLPSSTAPSPENSNTGKIVFFFIYLK